jgi:hypothetical protein
MPKHPAKSAGTPADRPALGPRFYRRSTILFAILLLFAYTLDTAPRLLSLSGGTLDNLNEVQKKQVDVYLGMVQLLITLATAVAGGLIAMVYARYDARTLPLAQTQRLLASWTLAGLSLLAGYVAYQNLLQLLALNLLDFTHPILLWPSRIQFVAFLACIATSVEFIWVGLRYEETKEGPKP